MATLMDIVTKDATSRSVTLRIVDSGDGTPETGVVFNTAGIDLWYRRESATVASITEIDLTTPALDDAYESGGFLHISNGEYRLDVPDAAFATGVNHVDIGGTVTGMVVIGGRVRLTDFDLETAAVTAATLVDNVWDENIVTGHGSASTAGFLLRVLGAAIATRSNSATLNALLGVADSASADVPSQTTDEVWDETSSSHVGAGSTGQVVNNLPSDGALTNLAVNTTLVNGTAQTAGDLAALITVVDTVVDAIKVITDALPSSVSADILTTALADAYAANTVAPTLQQAMMAVHQVLMAFAISGTTISVKKIDGSTSAFDVTLDDATNPTSGKRL